MRDGALITTGVVGGVLAASACTAGACGKTRPMDRYDLIIISCML
jgi:hypothetical protein